MGHNPVSLGSTRWHAANRRACVCKPLLVSRRKSVVMAGGTSRPRADGDVTSVDTAALAEVSRQKEIAAVFWQESVLCARLGATGHATSPLSGVVKFVDYRAAIRLHLLQTLHLHPREFSIQTLGEITGFTRSLTSWHLLFFKRFPSVR